VSLDPVETEAEGDSEGNQDTSRAVEMEEEEEEEDNQDLRAQALRALLLSRQRKHTSAESKGERDAFSLKPMLILKGVVHFSKNFC